MIDAATAEMMALVYCVAIGVIGFSFLWCQWRYIRKAEEEYKAYVREIVDRAMKERKL